MEFWRLIDDIPRSGSFNMAADQVLLENYVSNPVFRIYEWDCPTLSLGRNEVLDYNIDFGACKNLKIPLIRRSTGGKSVLHGFDITYSLVAGIQDTSFVGGVLDIYRHIAKGFYRFFEELGLKPEYNDRIQKNGKNNEHICFAVPSPYEILIEGRKIIGSAQKVKNIKLSNTSSCRVFLQHGTIPVKDTISLITKIFPKSNGDILTHKMHSLESVGIFPRYSIKKLKEMLYKCLKETFDIEWNYKNWKKRELNMIYNWEKNFQPIEI